LSRIQHLIIIIDSQPPQSEERLVEEAGECQEVKQLYSDIASKMRKLNVIIELPKVNRDDALQSIDSMGLINAQKATARGRSQKLKRSREILSLAEKHLVEHQKFLKDFGADWEREKEGSEEEQRAFLKKTFETLDEKEKKGDGEVEKLLVELKITPGKMAELDKAMAEGVDKAEGESLE
jgi:hypothetical protein